MLHYKYLTFGLTVVLVIIALALWRAGRELRRTRTPANQYDSILLRLHRGLVASMGCFTLILVLLIEAQVRLSPNPYVMNLPLFAFHLFIDAVMVTIAFVMVLRFTGVFDRRLHSALGYSFFGLLAISAATGFVLLYQLPVSP
jgi:hypothetical protein